jgi:hypothetical protein
MNSNVNVKVLETKLSTLVAAVFQLSDQIDALKSQLAVKRISDQIDEMEKSLSQFTQPKVEVTDPDFNRGFRGRPRSKTTRLLLTLKRNDTTFIPYPGKTRRSAKNIRRVSNAAKYVTKLTGARFSRRSMTGGVMITRVA